MATLSIVSFTLPNYHRPGTTARLKIWYSQNFVTLENQPIMGGAVRSGSFYVDELCSVDQEAHEITIPTFSLPTTNDSSVRNVRATALLFDSSGAFVQYLFTNWIIYSQLAPISTFAALDALNAPPTPPPQPTGITREQCLVLIEEGLQAEPVNGTFSTSAVPRATGPKTLVDGQAIDDGSNFKIQTLGDFQAGDYEEAQHGSLLSVNDTLGRVGLFAGNGPVETPSNEYAGVAGVCAQADAEVFLQSTGYSNVYGHKGTTRVGDGVIEHNGTYIEVDDVLQVIKLSNLPTSDPGIENALWKSGSDLKVSAG